MDQPVPPPPLPIVSDVNSESNPSFNFPGSIQIKEEVIDNDYMTFEEEPTVVSVLES